MLDPLLYYTYSYATLVMAFLVGAAYYCFRVTRLTGTFRAWIILIAAFSLFAAEVVANYLEIVLVYSVAQVDYIIHATDLTSFLLSSGYSIALSGLFFFAMFELFRTFKRTRG